MRSRRENMRDAELGLTMLGEAATREISRETEREGFSASMDVARQGGEVAGVARKALEERTGKPVITEKNAAQLNDVVTGMIEATAPFISVPVEPAKNESPVLLSIVLLSHDFSEACLSY